MKTDIPDFYLEQYRLGEADEKTARTIGEDPEALERLEALERESEKILEQYPPEEMTRIILERFAREQAAEREARQIGTASRIREWALRTWTTVRDGLNSPVVAIGAVAALVVALLPIFMAEQPAIGETGDVNAGIERIKGLDPELRVYRQSGPSEAEALTDESLAHEGDRLQIAYRAAGFRYGAIFSIDGNGYVTLHYPATADDSGELAQEGEVPLSYAYVLDDAPEFESFYMVLTTREIDVLSLISTIEQDIGATNGNPDLVGAIVERVVSHIAGEGEIRLERIDLRKDDGE